MDETAVPIGKEIAKALGKFMTEVPDIKKEADNPFFKSKYAALENILPVIRKPLQDNKLTVIQIPLEKNKLRTIIIHTESGEYIQATIEYAPKANDPQAQGSALTYMRRYMIVTMLCLNCELDDDGNSASGSTKAPARPVAAAKAPDAPMTPKQARANAEKAIKKSDTLEKIKIISKSVEDSKLLTINDKAELLGMIIDRSESIELARHDAVIQEGV